MASVRLAAIIAMSAVASSCGRAPGVYNLTVHDAYARLAQNPLSDFSFSQQCGILIHLTPEGTPDQSVTWHVYSSGQEMLSFTARLTPQGSSSTKVDIDVSKDSDGSEAYAGKDFYPRPALRQPLRPALAEAIGAVLEGRKFDVERIPKAAESDSVCNIQRGGLESGHRFSVNDQDLSSFSPGT
jgi:hypothetical protein